MDRPARILPRPSRKHGLAPGTLVHVGEQRLETAQVSLLRYDAASLHEELLNPAALPVLRPPETGTLWLATAGLHDLAVLEHIGSAFDVHPLALEDVAHTAQRPKIEAYGPQIFIVARAVHLDSDDAEPRLEQVSILQAGNVVLTFEEGLPDVFAPVRERLRQGRGRIREHDGAYLVYALLDVVVDGYFTALERLGDRIEDLEDAMLATPTPDILERLHRIRRSLIFMRNAIWPLRDVVLALQRGDHLDVDPGLQVYLRDLYDHSVRAAEMVESYRDLLTTLLDLHLSSLSNRMNAIMKVLTIIATVFIPLTFVTGVFGMNFSEIPGLSSAAVFWSVVGVMLGLGLGMLAVFRRQRWF